MSNYCCDRCNLPEKKNCFGVISGYGCPHKEPVWEQDKEIEMRFFSDNNLIYLNDSTHTTRKIFSGEDHGEYKVRVRARPGAILIEKV